MTNMPAWSVYAMLWVCLFLTVISAIINGVRALQYPDKGAAAVFVPRSVLSFGFMFVYVIRLTQSVRNIDDPVSMLSLTLGASALMLVWILPAMFYVPVKSPSEMLVVR